MPLNIRVQPWSDAVAKISAKTPIGSALRSDQWEGTALALREAGMFSARVQSANMLSGLQRGVLDALTGARTEGGAMMDRGRFISDMRKLAQELGVGQLGKSEITDMQGPMRLGLIFDQLTQQAAGFARWKTGQDPDFMNEFPAQRLIRIEQREDPRDWEERWDKAAGEVGYEGVSKTAMVAMKDSPIWTALSRFGTPWPPFDYGSGMGVEEVSREEAETMGLIRPGEVVEPKGEKMFTDNLEASTASITPDMLEKLKGFGLTVEGKKVVYKPTGSSDKTAPVTAKTKDDEGKKPEAVEKKAETKPEAKAKDDDKDMAEYIKAIKKQNANIAEFGKRIENKKREVFIVLGDDSKPLFKPHTSGKHGGRVPSKWLDKLEGTDFVHNHPSGIRPDANGHGVSFSTADIMTASKFKLRSISAASPKRIYVMRPGEKGWPDSDIIQNIFMKHFELIEKTVDKRIDKGLISEYIGWVAKYDMTWKKVAKELGMRYHAIKVK